MNKEIAKVDMSSGEIRQNNPASIASDLQSFVQQQGLSKVLKAGSNPFVFSEGWTFLLEKAGDTVKTSVDIQRNGGTVDVVSTATITHKNGGQTSATAVCSSSEKLGGRPRWDALHQLVSMSQTRAVSKASQMCYKHYMAMAGFATTPAEEMTEFSATPVDTAQHAQKIFSSSSPTQKSSTDNPASSKQIGLIKKLVAEKGENLDEVSARIKTSADASAEIERLMAKPVEDVPTPTAQVAEDSTTLDVPF